MARYAILDVLRSEGPLTPKQLQTLIGKSHSTIWKDLRSLDRRALVLRRYTFWDGRRRALYCPRDENSDGYIFGIWENEPKENILRVRTIIQSDLEVLKDYFSDIDVTYLKGALNVPDNLYWVYVAEQSNDVKGAMLAFESPDHVEILRIFVSKQFRGQKIGTWLVKSLITSKPLLAEVLLKDRAAYLFFGSLRFKTVGHSERDGEPTEILKRERIEHNSLKKFSEEMDEQEA
ncbi:MAG: GNAT family N-acetyltransferase [Promethearchaeota archaeon]